MGSKDLEERRRMRKFGDHSECTYPSKATWQEAEGTLEEVEDYVGCGYPVSEEKKS